jgi:hypothetical protein
MDQRLEAQLIAAIMKGAGVTEVFVAAEHLEGFGMDGEVLVSIQDFMRDGWTFRLRRPAEILEGEVIVQGPPELEA